MNSEVTNQVSKKLNELKRDLKTQTLESINSAINVKVLPTIQNTIFTQGTVLGTNLDYMSSPVD